MVKIRDMDEKQLEQQLEKHNKIIKALRRERAKRLSKETIQTQTGQRVRKTGTVTNLKIDKTQSKIIEGTSSSIYQLKMDDEELSKISELTSNIKPAAKQMTISKLIIQSQIEAASDKDD